MYLPCKLGEPAVFEGQHGVLTEEVVNQVMNKHKASQGLEAKGISLPEKINGGRVIQKKRFNQTKKNQKNNQEEAPISGNSG